MKVATINGNVIVDRIPITHKNAMISAGKKVLSVVCYDENPDNSHGHYSRKNMDHYTEKEMDVSVYTVFKAIIGYYQPHQAYDKLVEIGIINQNK